MAKFVVGQTVKALKSQQNGIVINGLYTVEKIIDNNWLKLVGYPHYIQESNFSGATESKALGPKETIVITTDGLNATAKYVKANAVVREVALKRAEGDCHNMKTLAAYAVQKLFPKDGNMIINVKAGYTGAVAVINSKNQYVQDGRILEFTSGRCTNSNMFSVHEFADLAAVKKYCKMRHINFEVVELHRR